MPPVPADESSTFWNNKGTIYGFLFPSAADPDIPPPDLKSTLLIYSTNLQWYSTNLKSLLPKKTATGHALFALTPDSPYTHTFSIPFPTRPTVPLTKHTTLGTHTLSSRNATVSVTTDSPMISLLVTVLLLHYVYLLIR